MKRSDIPSQNWIKLHNFGIIYFSIFISQVESIKMEMIKMQGQVADAEKSAKEALNKSNAIKATFNEIINEREHWKVW